jgi:hypothetical protein
MSDRKRGPDSEGGPAAKKPRRFVLLSLLFDLKFIPFVSNSDVPVSDVSVQGEWHALVCSICLYNPFTNFQAASNGARPPGGVNIIWYLD